MEQVTHSTTVPVYNVLRNTENGKELRYMIFVKYDDKLLMIDTKTLNVCEEFKDFQHFSDRYKLDVATRIYG